MPDTRRTPVALLATLAALLAAAAGSRAAAQAAKTAGTVEHVRVHGASLVGNLSGDAADRMVSVYLPPGYAEAKTRRYPVVYLLHGFTDNDDRWFGRVQHFVNVPQAADKALAAGTRDLIIVMPNAFTKFKGSMYSNSVVTGDWESFIARDLVAYVDAHYRTIASATGRGLAGHSMGGYGVLRIGMRHPSIFSSVYALSPCCMVPNLAPPASTGPSRAEAVKTQDEVDKADFGTLAQLASAAAWSPNPKNPPFFIDLPTRDGQPQPLVLAKWAANAPLAMVDSHLKSLKGLTGLAIDAGDKDEGIAATVQTLHAILAANDVPHVFEIYEGDHVNRIGARLETKMLPFFSERLARDPSEPRAK
jgi:S-formylglutathione hydrolase